MGVETINVRRHMRSPKEPDNTKELALAIAENLENGKGSRVTVLDVHEMTLIADYFVIASGSNLRHVRAMADGLTHDLRDMRIPLHVEGYGSGYWILLDYGDVVVHVFREEERAFYGLERLWGDAPKVEFRPQVPVE